MTQEPLVSERPWETLSELIGEGDTQTLATYMQELPTAETALVISRLSEEEQQRLLTLLPPEHAAEVLDAVPETQAVELIEDLSHETAAAIVDELQSDFQADLLGELDETDAKAILGKMTPEEAKDARKLMKYEPNTAGGIMVTEYLSYRQESSARDVIDDLQTNQEKYVDYHVQYMYVIDESKVLTGVVPMRNLLFARKADPLSAMMIAKPLAVGVGDTLEQLENFFEEHDWFGAPVVDAKGRLVGVVQREDVDAAAQKRVEKQYLGFAGIIGGEEFRSMPLYVRSGRRLAWLSANIVLNIIAASVIAVYQDTLQAAIALAVFLPMISDMSGCSGNQAVAVSMRELTLGLVRPTEFLRVFFKESVVGIVNGLALGILLGTVAAVWKDSVYLGLVVGIALAGNTLLSVCLGGLLPLVFKRLKLDPALVCGPVLTTVTDMAGFFFVLSIATSVLDKLPTS